MVQIAWFRVYRVLEGVKLIDGDRNQNNGCLWEWRLAGNCLGRTLRELLGVMEMFYIVNPAINNTCFENVQSIQKENWAQHGFFICLCVILCAGNTRWMQKTAFGWTGLHRETHISHKGTHLTHLATSAHLTYYELQPSKSFLLLFQVILLSPLNNNSQINPSNVNFHKQTSGLFHNKVHYLV